jgi:hypothetical protein
MSIELLIIPIGIAAWRAYKEYRRTDVCDGCIESRVNSAELLCRALESLGVTDFKFEESVVTAKRGTADIRFLHVEDAFVGRIDGATEEENRTFVEEVDRAAGRLIQNDKVEAMRTRAAQLGLRLVGEETAEDGTVQMLFEEIEA